MNKHYQAGYEAGRATKQSDKKTAQRLHRTFRETLRNEPDIDKRFAALSEYERGFTVGRQS